MILTPVVVAFELEATLAVGLLVAEPPTRLAEPIVAAQPIVAA